MKRVAFDIGNVLCHVNMNGFFEYLVSKGIFNTVKEADEFISGIQYSQDLGLYNIRQGFYKFKLNLSKKDLDEIYTAWIGNVNTSEDMLNLLDEILSNGYEVALLSNIGFDHSSFLRKKCPVFNKCIQHFSCEIGTRKPLKLFYQSFISEYNWSNDIYFFDDRIENIESANGLFIGKQFDLNNFDSDFVAANHIRKILDI